MKRMKNIIKEVNGVKILRRHTFASFIYAFFCFLIVLIPVVMLFLPSFSMVYSLGGGEEIVLDLSALKLITNEIFSLFNKGSSSIVALFSNFETPTFMPLIGQILHYVIPFLWVILALFTLFFLFFALELVFRGRMTNFKVPYIMSWIVLIVVLLISLCSVGLDLFLKFISDSINKVTPDAFKIIEVTSWYSFIFLGTSFISMVILGILYHSCFKGKIFIGDVGDLKPGYANSKPDEPVYIEKIVEKVIEKEKPVTEPKPIEVTNIKTVRKIEHVIANDLPSGLTSIGGHAFSNNQNIVTASIPLNIRTLGDGAFSNCGSLTTLNIPRTIVSIGNNCFFNTPSLKHINYAGNKRDWSKIKRGYNWLLKSGTNIVYCSDGPISVNTKK